MDSKEGKRIVEYEKLYDEEGTKIGQVELHSDKSLTCSKCGYFDADALFCNLNGLSYDSPEHPNTQRACSDFTTPEQAKRELEIDEEE